MVITLDALPLEAYKSAAVELSMSCLSDSLQFFQIPLRPWNSNLTFCSSLQRKFAQ